MVADKNFIWLASFPKSGNTWVRHIIRQLRGGNQLPKGKSDRLNFGVGCSSKELYATTLEADTTNLTPIEYFSGGRINFLEEWNSRAKRQNIFAKTHNACVEVKGYPLIPDSVSNGAIVMVRNPFDVAASSMNHFGIHEEQAVKFVTDANSNLSESETQFAQLCLSWDHFLVSWITNFKQPLLIIRYEDLLESPLHQLHRICRFLGLTKRDPELLAIIDDNRFDKLQSQERQHGFSESSEFAKEFFYRGTSNYFKQILSDEAIDEINIRLGNCMKQVGYELDHENKLVKIMELPSFRGTQI